MRGCFEKGPSSRDSRAEVVDGNGKTVIRLLWVFRSSLRFNVLGELCEKAITARCSTGSSEKVDSKEARGYRFLTMVSPQAATSLRLMMFMATMSVIPSGVSNSMMLTSEDNCHSKREMDGWMNPQQLGTQVTQRTQSQCQ